MVFVEIADVRRFHDQVTQEEVQSLFEELGAHFQLDDACTCEKLSLPLRVAIALEKFVEHFDLQAVAFHADGYPDSIEEKIAYSMTLGGSLLTARSRPFIAEGDLGLSVPMIIFNTLGFGASQTEVNVANFDEGIVFLSHSGPGDLSMADGKPTLQWLDYFHGRRGSGVSCSFAFRPEPVTILSLSTDQKGEFRLIAAEGVVRKASRLKNGNVNSGIDFGRPIHEFIERWTVLGPTHHSVIGYGHNTAQLAKVADILGITFIHI